jgi:hypothetical protein
MKNRRSRRGCAVLAFASAVLGSSLYAQDAPLQPDDPVFGTWVLDLEKSDFRTRRAPRSQIRIYEPHPDGLKGTVITVDGRGMETTTEFVYRYDGVDYPFSGRPDADSIALQRTGPLTATSTFSHAGRVIGSALRTISPDGKELTIRVEFESKISSIEVFKRKE